MRREVAPRLDTVRERVELWRQRGGGRGTRIPDDLWRAAVQVARVEGVYATAQALRFNYYSLKERVDQAETESLDGAGAQTFVELAMPPLGAGATSKMVLEFVGRSGARMRIDVMGANAVDVAGLAQAFWERES
jgi:hypothetical protein